MTITDLEHAWTTVEDTIRGYLHRRLRGDAATVDDLAQEVFLRLHHGIEDLHTAGSLGPWVVRIARGVLVDHLRRRRPSTAIEGLDLPDDEVEDGQELSALGAFLREQVRDLPAHEAAVIGLVDLEGIPPARAAERLAIGLPALKARLHRGRQRLRRAIARCCAVTLDGRGQPTQCIPHGAGCGACSTDSTATDSTATITA